jgi:hypothetical protein
MSFVELFIVFIIVVILIMYIHNYVNSEVEYVKSTIDGRSYLVLSLPDKQKAADYIADINRDMMRLIKHLKAKHPEDEDYERLYRNYNPDAISEGSPESNYTSYTVNKSSLVLCIRQTDTHAFVPKNVVLYPVIHEVSHLACNEVGHTPKFWKLFKQILQEAIDIDIYKKQNFKANPQPYCGLILSTSIL